MDARGVQKEALVGQGGSVAEKRGPVLSYRFNRFMKGDSVYWVSQHRVFSTASEGQTGSAPEQGCRLHEAASSTGSDTDLETGQTCHAPGSAELLGLTAHQL